MPTSIGYDSSLKEQMWRSGVILEAERSTNLMLFAGTDENDAFYILDKPGGGRGDSVTYRFSRPNDEDLKTSTSQVLGNESRTEFLEDSVQMRYFFFDGGIDNIISSQQMVQIDLKASERSRIARQWAYRWEEWILNQLAGNDSTSVTGAADKGRSGGNSIVTPDSNHHEFAPGTSAHTTESGVGGDSTAVMTTDLIDEMVTKATSKDYVKWPIPPCNTPYGDLYVLVLHGRGYKQIRENSSDTDFYDIEKAKIQGGNSLDANSLIHGEGFIYNKTLVLRSDFAPQKTANTRRGVFFGAKAGCWVFGEGFTEGEHLGWSEHVQHRRWSCLSDSMSGFKVTVPQESDTSNNERFGNFVVTHYSDV